MKKALKKIVPASVWRRLRELRIVSRHAEVASICESLVGEYFAMGETADIRPLKDPGTSKIIWQYWAQGYDNVPDVVRECLDSVEKYRGDYCIIRLDDSNVSDYVSIPDKVVVHCREAGLAQYSDLLRLALLCAYGGVWLDATVKLTGPLPDEFAQCDFFMYQRDPDELSKDYWENTYAYYFGWAKGFRVNVLSSVIFSHPGNDVISAMYGLFCCYWQSHDALPDYFFFMILFDVLINGRMKGQNCPIVSDCLPHLLQQYRNDPSFSLMSEEEIYRRTTIHKLTYKSE